MFLFCTKNEVSQIRRKLRIRSHLLKKYFIEIFIFCAVRKISQETFICSTPITEALEKVENMFKVNNEDTRTTSTDFVLLSLC